MSIGGDIISEAIALLHWVRGQAAVSIREYAGELDDRLKAGFVIPDTLYVEQSAPLSTILVEHRAVADISHAQPTDDQRTEHAMTIWLVSGFSWLPSFTAGDHDRQGHGLRQAIRELFDDSKLLTDTLPAQLVSDERVYFGNADRTSGAPAWTEGTLCAAVYRIEFSITEVLPAEGDSAIPDPIIVPVDNEWRIDFSERSDQRFPVDQASWHAAFPSVPAPTAIFPCLEEFQDDPYNPVNQMTHIIRDVVTGIELSTEPIDPTAVLHRRSAVGIQTIDTTEDRRFNPVQGIEFTQPKVHFQAADNSFLDPPNTTKASRMAVSGFVVARLRQTDDDDLLMGKWDEQNGWKLEISSFGEIKLQVHGAGIDHTLELNHARHDTEQWIGILFSFTYGGNGVTTATLCTPQEITTEEVTPSEPGQVPEEFVFDINAPFALGGATGQIAYACYWQGPIRRSDMATPDNYRTLWRGTTHPVNNGEKLNVISRRTTKQVTAWPVANTGTGEAVAKFDTTSGVRPQDPVVHYYGKRALPHDRARRNLISHSEDFSHGSWDGALIGPTVTGPDGLHSAYELEQDETISRTITLDAGDHVFSVWARTGDSGLLTVVTPPLPGETNDTVQLFELTRRWQRFAAVVQSGDITLRSVGDPGSSIEIWGAQLESGTHPFTYVYANGEPETVEVNQCYVDWQALGNGPLADSGEVNVELVPGAEMADADLERRFSAFQIRDELDYHLSVWGDITPRGLSFRLGVSLPELECSNVAREAIAVREGTPINVGVRWSSLKVELLVNGTVAATREAPETGPIGFAKRPSTCHLMRIVCWEHWPWIGACREIRWRQ